jgi:hypothetical protein
MPQQQASQQPGSQFGSQPAPGTQGPGGATQGQQCQHGALAAFNSLGATVTPAAAAPAGPSGAGGAGSSPPAASDAKRQCCTPPAASPYS